MGRTNSYRISSLSCSENGCEIEMKEMRETYKTQNFIRPKNSNKGEKVIMERGERCKARKRKVERQRNWVVREENAY